MRRVGLILAAVWMLEGPSGQAKAASVDDVAWLAGCWAAENAEPGSGEHWMAPAGGSLVGVGRRVRDGRTVDYEWLRIVEGADGALTYLAAPGGREPVPFALTNLAEDRAVFENPDHDFPQRVIYRIRGDRLLARIEGAEDGILRRVDFPMRRTACPAG